MARKLRIRPQPPIQRWTRGTESRPLWLGAVVALLGVSLAIAAFGFRHPVRGADDTGLAQWQIVEQVTHDGVTRAQGSIVLAAAQASAGKSPATGPATQPATQPSAGEGPPRCKT
jgi:hypothetical protein